MSGLVDSRLRPHGSEIAEPNQNHKEGNRAKECATTVYLQQTDDVFALPPDCGDGSRTRCRSRNRSMAVSTLWSHLPLRALEDPKTSSEKAGGRLALQQSRGR